MPRGCQEGVSPEIRTGAVGRRGLARVPAVAVWVPGWRWGRGVQVVRCPSRARSSRTSTTAPSRYTSTLQPARCWPRYPLEDGGDVVGGHRFRAPAVSAPSRARSVSRALAWSWAKRANRGFLQGPRRVLRGEKISRGLPGAGGVRAARAAGPTCSRAAAEVRAARAGARPPRGSARDAFYRRGGRGGVAPWGQSSRPHPQIGHALTPTAGGPGRVPRVWNARGVS